jgi:hypothetical protein
MIGVFGTCLRNELWQLTHLTPEWIATPLWRMIYEESLEMSWVESYVTTDGQPANLSWNKAPIWGLRPDLYYLCDSCGFVDLGRPLWREDGSVVYNFCWPLPAQSFSGPSPLGLETIFYCLRFETSLFVASYDSLISRIHEWTPFYNCERTE